ncbi:MULTISPECIES: NAD-dependent epimerase/dehydratase family protein [Pseudomonas]|uniref:NAD(P)-dependent oxidoreductase n=1 Tax=Pseudomonas putida TaxID=303 RepID=A0A7W2KXC3_PSEPU|nr:MULTISPECIES: NAD(P)-dependent oxidoreductase [Pseudomonas]MBA6114554.1 NAD(P)-dependent oxidoreductase [Pseudomonas putida]MCZ9638787.1 NAD(P)-dependent oxidoreductase [Pseudomonas putida]
MKSLVIGSTSTIGKAVARSLARLGPVKLAGRREADILFDLSQPVLPPGDQAFDVVIHAAADFGGAEPDDLMRTEQVNGIGALAACRLAEHCGARHFILLSSRWAAHQPGDPYYGIYALSKRHAEELVSLYCQARGMALTILRISQVYDSQARCRVHQPLLYAIGDNAAVGKTVYLYGSNDARRNYLHLDDLAEICVRVAERRVEGVHNCGHPQDPRLSEIAQAAFAAFGTPPDIRFVPEKDDIPDLPPFVCSGELFERIGYAPQIGIGEGFELIKTHREQQA